MQTTTPPLPSELTAPAPRTLPPWAPPTRQMGAFAAAYLVITLLVVSVGAVWLSEIFVRASLPNQPGLSAEVLSVKRYAGTGRVGSGPHGEVEVRYTDPQGATHTEMLKVAAETTDDLTEGQQTTLWHYKRLWVWPQSTLREDLAHDMSLGMSVGLLLLLLGPWLAVVWVGVTWLLGASRIRRLMRDGVAVQGRVTAVNRKAGIGAAEIAYVFTAGDAEVHSRQRYFILWLKRFPRQPAVDDVVFVVFDPQNPMHNTPWSFS